MKDSQVVLQLQKWDKQTCFQQKTQILGESVGKEKSPRNLLTTIYPSNVEKNLQN